MIIKKLFVSAFIVSLSCITYSAMADSEGDFVFNMLTKDYQGAYLEKRSFEGLNLEGYNFAKAKLDRTNFKNANLKNANFKGADIENATFEWC